MVGIYTEVIELSDFRKDLKFSEKFVEHWDQFYKSKDFYSTLQKIRRKGEVKIKKIDRSGNTLFQKETHLDTIIQLSTGSSLLVDEKVLRYPMHDDWLNTFPVEVCCNPNNGGKRDGWGYHIGVTICMAFSDPFEAGFFTPPVVYTISNKFIDEVVRNNTYEAKQSRSTDGLYQSTCKFIPRNVLKKYFP
jgi:hypothetical protein